jgi:hypothetical protein
MIIKIKTFINVGALVSFLKKYSSHLGMGQSVEIAGTPNCSAKPKQEGKSSHTSFYPSMQSFSPMHFIIIQLRACIKYFFAIVI